MGTKDPRIDTYIKKAAPFAQPILTHLRALIHAGCPDVAETLKWSHPSFTYKGILCMMASFKGHCSLNFWKGSLVVGKQTTEEAMGQFGKLTSLADLPADKILLGYVKEAARLNEEGVMPKKARTPAPGKVVAVPREFAELLKKNPKAKKVFEEFSYSNRKEYVEWIKEAKTEETRSRRLATAIEWIAQGKGRNWKYER